MKTDFHSLTQEETKRLLAAISPKRDHAYPGVARKHFICDYNLTRSAALPRQHYRRFSTGTFTGTSGRTLSTLL